MPILPEPWQYIIPDDKKQQFDVLRSLMERDDVTGLVCATDAGREGELIFRFVYQMAGCRKPFERLWISSMEDSAIKDGFAHLKPGHDYDPLYQSALCRAKADWLIGINATRLFSVLYHKTLTVGRVQTPTLKMLVDRDAKITDFKKEKYHIVHIAAGGADAVSSRFSDAAEANTVKAACAGAQAVCASVAREKKTEQPPKLYDLTTLQREANRRFGFTAKQTLDYGICLLLVHHTRKQQSDDKFDMISGTNGLLGAADGAFLLTKEKRTGNAACLDVSGRDQADQRLHLFRNGETLAWELERVETELWKAPPEPLLEQVSAFLSSGSKEWAGTPTELAALLGVDMKPNALTRRLNVNAGRLLNEYGIRYESSRSRSERTVKLTADQA